MREIKFRAWGHFGGYAKDNMIQNWQSSDLIEYVGLDGGGHFEIMQYTGLKDKNGKEIYEGDIVETSGQDDQYYPRKIVAYTSDIVNENDGDWDEWYCGFDLIVPGDECGVLHYQLSNKVEVIGNIYENEELCI